MIIIGIDPGKSGAFAVITTSINEVRTFKIPETDGDVLQLFRSLNTPNNEEIPVYIEKVGGFIGKIQPGARMFTFGKNFGFLLGCLMTLGFKVNLVPPQKWQKAFGVGTKSDSSTKEWKNKLKAEAQRLYPKLDISLQVADALLIAEYGRRCENGTQS